MLSGLPSGIDSSLGLSIFDEDETLYVQVLKSIAENHAKDADNFLRELSQGKDAEAVKIAHNIKGMAGNIGATTLYERAADAEECLRNNSPDKEKICRAFAEEMNRIVEDLRKYFSKENAGAGGKTRSVPGTKENFLSILTRLKPALAERKPKLCGEVCSELNNYIWPEVWRPEMEALKKAVQNYQFSEAEEAIGRIELIISKPL